MPLQFSPETKQRFDALVTRYPQKKAALLPALWLAQEEFGGWLSPEALEYVAGLLDLPPSKAYSVASFYTMYNLQPVGKYKIEVCRTLSCAMAGAFEIIEHMEKKLGVHLGETTPDGKFTLATQECLAACGYAPMCQINGKQYHEHLTPAKVDELLASLP
jgi:NADH-quinone oxidoreductase subunit E